MSKEAEWVAHIKRKLVNDLRDCDTDSSQIHIESGIRLSYTNEILQYEKDLPSSTQMKYQTDLLVYEQSTDGKVWIPRIVIEAKFDSVTTHDALAYSSKAATHKQVHPYLRYGIIIGSYGDYSLPPRLVRHGAYFDFMMVFSEFEPTHEEWGDFLNVLKHEIEGSKKLQGLLTDRSKSKIKYKFLHRPLDFK